MFKVGPSYQFEKDSANQSLGRNVQFLHICLDINASYKQGNVVSRHVGVSSEKMIIIQLQMITLEFDKGINV